MIEILSERDAGLAVLRALNKFLDADVYLLRVDANERSITHRLAMYLQEEFSDWDVDCEYNRDGNDPKELLLPVTDASERDTDAQTVYPDIIVHKRGQQKNLLVIEAKKTSSPVSDTRDHTKLVEYRRQLKYAQALFLEFEVSSHNPGVARAAWIDEPQLDAYR